jgi:hypothetical protein
MSSLFVRIALCIVLLGVAGEARGDDWMDNLDQGMDNLDQALRVNLFNGSVTAQLSGLMDIEGYYIQQPPTGLYSTNGNFLFNPRLTLNLDVEITPAIYGFVEARVDRGFDPSNGDIDTRFDQYGISYKPRSDNPFRIQVGKFSSVVGTYSEREDSWANPFVNAPLPYENLTGISDRSVPASPETFLSGRFETNDAYQHLPIMWGPNYASGVSLFGQIGDEIDLALEAKNASISSRPGSWNVNSSGLDHPTWTGHADWRPSPTWRFGLSGSVGPYLQPGTGLNGASTPMPVIPDGRNIYNYDQSTVAQDVTFAWRHWQLWAECFESRFDVPRVGNADTLAYYVEAKYKFTPQFFGAVRWNQQLFATVPVGQGESEKWGNDIWRIDAAITYRWTERIQTKLQYSFTDQNLPGANQEHLIAAQLTVRF